MKTPIELTENQAQSVAKGSLTPHQSGCVDGLSRAIDVAATHPGGSHGENAHKESNGTAGEHHLLLGIIAGLLLATGPDAHHQDEQVEEHNAHHSGDIDHLASERISLASEKYNQTRLLM